MHKAFLNFVFDVLEIRVSIRDYIIIKNSTDFTDPCVMKIRQLMEIWNELPLRGKDYYIEECKKYNERQEYEFLNTPRISYSEYVNMINDVIEHINIEQIQYIENDVMSVDDFEEYNQRILTKKEYESLSYPDYFILLNLKLPRIVSPFIYFINNVDLNVEDDRSLVEIWYGLPHKGKLDY